MSTLPPFETIKPLFKPIAERARLQRALGLTSEVVEGHLQRDYQGSTGPHICIDDPQASEITPHVAIARRSSWLSAHLDRPVFQVRHLIGEREPSRVTALNQLLGRISDESPGALVILRAPTSMVSLSQQVMGLGFKMIGVEVTGVSKLDAAPPLASAAVDEAVNFRDVTRIDLTRAQEIASEAHVHNHFSYDPQLSDERARHLFREQVASQHERDRSSLIGAYRGDELLGFIVANRVSTFVTHDGPLLGNLDFICVDPRCQLKGLGHALNLAALERLYRDGIRRVSVRTMVCNFAAQAILARIGWRAMIAESVFHAEL